MIYKTIQTRRFRWIMLTVVCGLLPLTIRVFSGGTSSILITDVILLGLMLNASAMANVTAARFMPAVYVGVIFTAFFFSACLASAYPGSSIAGEEATVFRWIAVGVLIFCGAVLAYFTTDDDAMETIQAAFDLADRKSMLTPKSRELTDRLFDEAIKNKDLEQIRKMGVAIRRYEQIMTVEREFLE